MKAFLKYFCYFCTRLIRMGRKNGFGIQSPWAFNFVRNVVYTHQYDVILDELEYNFDHIYFFERKLGRLAYILSHYTNTINPIIGVNVPKSILHYIGSVTNEEETPIDLAIFSFNDETEIESYIAQAGPGSLMLLLNIHGDNRSSGQWQKIQEDNRVGITFDLYYCGIVCFNRNIYKQHYKI